MQPRSTSFRCCVLRRRHARKKIDAMPMEFRALARLRSDARRHQINGACARACVLRSTPWTHRNVSITRQRESFRRRTRFNYRVVNGRTRKRWTVPKYHNNEAIEDSRLRPVRNSKTRKHEQTDRQTQRLTYRRNTSHITSQPQM